MYWPHELPTPRKQALDLENKLNGKRTYHGTNELIASNFLDIISVASMAGKARVDDLADGSVPHSDTNLYWRQFFSKDTNELSVRQPMSARCEKLTEIRNCHGFVSATDHCFPTTLHISVTTRPVAFNIMKNVSLHPKLHS